jgi:2-methylcitrate dehydratase PrpD
MTIAQQFADFLASTTTAGPQANQQAKAALFDLTIATIAGFSTKGAQAARDAARSSWGSGTAPVWFAGERLTVPGAAFANSAAASMLDLDDGHRAAAGHPGASIIPAVLATAAVHATTDDRILTAVALGYDVAIRIAASRDFAALTTMVSGPWVGQGAAAAAAWLRGLDRSATAQAIAIAGASAPNLAAVAYSRVMGNHLKEGIPWATATGLAAVDLAAAGFTGPTDLLDNDAIFDRTKLLEGLGEVWAIEGIYFKPYSCCRWAHAAIDAILALKAELAFSARDVTSIRIHTFGWALRLNNDCEPVTLESAQYSVPFCVALAAVRGAEPLVRLSENSLVDLEVLALAKRVELVLDPTFETLFPAAVPARVVIETPAGRFEKAVMAPLGEPTNPLDWSALECKFRTVASGHLSMEQSNSLLRSFERLALGEIRPLVATMSGILSSEQGQAPGQADR